MRPSNPRERLTALAREKHELEKIMTEAKNSLATHPLKPEPGRTYDVVELAAWTEAKRKIMARRGPTAIRLKEIFVEAAEIKSSMSQQSMSKIGIAKLIDREAEVKFDDSKDKAHDALTAVIDWLEQEERRMFVEDQVERLEAAS
jgi:hypothetical protein